MSHPVQARPRTLRTALLIIGSAIILGIVVTLVVTLVASANRKDPSREVTIETAFSSIDVTSEVADVRIEYGAVADPTVTFARNGERDMSFDAEVVGSTLVVTVVDHGTGWWMPQSAPHAPRLTIVLPDSLEPVAVTLDSDVGDIVLDGDFAAVSLIGTLGELRLGGSAASLEIERTAGDVVATDYSVSGAMVILTNAGDVVLKLADVPSSLEVTSNAGDQDVSLPTGDYEVDASTNLGDVDVQVESNASAATTLRFESTLGDITVRN